MPHALAPLCAVRGCRARATRRGRCAAHQPLESQRHNADVRRWYRTPRWFALRRQKQLEQPLCGECLRRGRLEPWTDLDHVRPHRGDPERFWDSENLVGLCKRCHSEKTKAGR